MELEQKKGVLFVDGCSAEALAEKYGTPLYVYSETELVRRIREIRSQFTDRYPNTRAAYAGKAFCVLALCKILEREGMALDVVSGGELYTAIQAEFPPERIEFNGNNKQRWELEMAVEYGIGRVIVDGLQELELLESVCAEKNKKTDILYRITPGVQSDTHDYIVTGKKDSKFGIPLDNEILYPAIEKALSSKWVRFRGVHFHVGSQLLDNRSHLQALEVALSVMEETYRCFAFTMTELNLGGGFGIRYLESDERKSFAYFVDPMMARIDAFCATLGVERPAVVIEPGRSIVGEAGITLYRVGSIKEIPGVRKYLSVDGGMTDNIRPALYGAEYRAVIANKMDAPKEDCVTVCGKCCESGDILIRDLDCAKAEMGDLVAVLATGAYCYSMSSHYNKLTTPPVVLVKEGQDQLIVRGQSLEQLIQNERLPDLSWGQPS